MSQSSAHHSDRQRAWYAAIPEPRVLESLETCNGQHVESFDRAVISYVNGIEICVAKDDTLAALYNLRPKSILIFFKPSVAGRGNQFPNVVDQLDVLGVKVIRLMPDISRPAKLVDVVLYKYVM